MEFTRIAEAQMKWRGRLERQPLPPLGQPLPQHWQQGIYTTFYPQFCCSSLKSNEYEQ
jgi:hypothetical protein